MKKIQIQNVLYLKNLNGKHFVICMLQQIEHLLSSILSTQTNQIFLWLSHKEKTLKLWLVLKSRYFIKNEISIKECQKCVK